MAKPKQILFISHNAGYTGAPIVFLNFLKWFKKHSDIPFQILLRDGGLLEKEFRTLAPVCILSTGIQGFWGRQLNRIGLDKAVDYLVKSQVRRNFLDDNIALIYSNTVTNGVILDALSYLNCPVITHVHELEQWIQNHTGLDKFNLAKTNSSHFVAVSDAVRQNLLDNHFVPWNKIDVVNEFVPTSLANAIDILQSRHQVCAQEGIPHDALIVGASGTTDWRKGPDLFVKVARQVISQTELPVYFIWVGGESKKFRFAALRNELRLITDFKGRVRFIGFRSNSLKYYAAFDVFALTSREDPFPLVMLETASLGKPIVCFDESGGAREFVSDDCGFVVPYLNVEAMAGKIVQLLRTPDLRNRMGQQAKHKVRSHYDISIIAPKLLKVIERFYMR